MHDRRSNRHAECPTSHSGMHIWVGEDGLLALYTPSALGVHIHTCLACGCVRMTVVRADGTKGRKYTDAR